MKLIIPKPIEEKIHAYVMAVNSEIAGMGKVKLTDPTTIEVVDVMIYEQEVSGATADLSTQAIARWQTELVRRGESPKEWRLWWHSHDTMAAFFSKRDTDTMDLNTDSDWMISLVVNKKREREARLDLYRPFRMFIEAGVEVEGDKAFTIPADIALEVSQKVKASMPAIGYKWDAKADAYRYADPYKGSGYKKAKEETADDYTKAEVADFIKILGDQLDDLEARGLGGSGEYWELKRELADWYYELANLEADEATAESIADEARAIESDIVDAEKLTAEYGY
jgi:hypothetical protein